MTTDLQRMHQDEWLSELRMADQQGYGIEAIESQPYCALGHARALGQFDRDGWLEGACEWLGISFAFGIAIYQSNDANEYPEAESRLSDALPRSLPEIADWFKGERDTVAGDLTKWKPAS